MFPTILLLSNPRAFALTVPSVHDALPLLCTPLAPSYLWKLSVNVFSSERPSTIILLTSLRGAIPSSTVPRFEVKFYLFIYVALFPPRDGHSLSVELWVTPGFL